MSVTWCERVAVKEDMDQLYDFTSCTAEQRTMEAISISHGYLSFNEMSVYGAHCIRPYGTGTEAV